MPTPDPNCQGGCHHCGASEDESCLPGCPCYEEG
jgi:hypothetical protein